MRIVLSALAPDVGGMTKDCRVFAHFRLRLVKNANAALSGVLTHQILEQAASSCSGTELFFRKTSNDVMCAEAVWSTHPPQRVLWLSEQPQPITGGGRRDPTLADGD